MNATQRAPWRGLTKVNLPKPFNGHMGLCHFCRYADLEKINGGDCNDNPTDAWTGSDCWGFRPKYTIEESADIVGVYLNGGHPDFGAILKAKKTETKSKEMSQ